MRPCARLWLAARWGASGRGESRAAQLGAIDVDGADDVYAQRGALELEPLLFARAIGAPTSFAAFIDLTLEELARLLDATLVTFNRLDMVTRHASVVTRPFHPEHPVSVELVNQLLREHPLWAWGPRQTVWPVVRLSDVASPEELAASALYRDVLLPMGAGFSIFVFVSSTQSTEWVYFVANRRDRDFSADDVRMAVSTQPALVAAVSRWSSEIAEAGAVALTSREVAVLGHLASGRTADAIAHVMGIRPATVRKHLQNIYAKLAVQDRLGAVMRAREIGLLNEADISGDVALQIRTEMAVAQPDLA